MDLHVWSGERARTTSNTTPVSPTRRAAPCRALAGRQPLPRAVPRRAQAGPVPPRHHPGAQANDAGRHGRVQADARGGAGHRRLGPIRG
eukprot:194445-Chlamydomonas_euryale.AAC.2